jgi:hypothetical protein
VYLSIIYFTSSADQLSEDRRHPQVLTNVQNRIGCLLLLKQSAS